ncbi:MAG: hypothetical protein QM662_18770 [Gordonia sp. (in: high G+C Gram-positive bacteria)]
MRRWQLRRMALPAGIAVVLAAARLLARRRRVVVTEAAEPQPVVEAPRHAAVIVTGLGRKARAHAVLVLATGVDAEEIIEIAYFDSTDGNAGPLAVDAFAHLQQIAVDRDLRVEVYIANTRVRNWFVTGPPHSHLVPAELGYRVGATSLRDVADDALRARITAPPAAATDAPPGPIVIATDASARSGRPGIGIAYVTETGEWRQDYLPAASVINIGELQAILLALTDRRERQITVLTDSRCAVDAITRGRDGQGKAIVHRIREQMQGREVTVTWVRGHAGNPLNEAADRLARAARRNAAAGVADEVRYRIAANIVEELVTARVEQR